MKYFIFLLITVCLSIATLARVTESGFRFSSVPLDKHSLTAGVGFSNQIDGGGEHHWMDMDWTISPNYLHHWNAGWMGNSSGFLDKHFADSSQNRSLNPNEMTATPEGYDEPHFILTGDSIEYRIRFQNTGSLVVEDVFISDILDTNVFNLESFQPLYASAPFTTSLLDDGTLGFTFNDIFLPDSASDEDGSHGFVVFCVELKQELLPGTVIFNSADIFFDQNPALTTNTVFHTVFDCESFVVPSVVEDLCENDMVAIGQEQPFVSSYHWSLDGAMVSDSAVCELAAPPVGEHVIDWMVSNPLCSSSESFVLHVQPLPSLVLDPSLEVCEGTDVILNAISDGELIWDQDVLNGTVMTIQTDVLFTAHATSVYGCVNEAQWSVNSLPIPLAEITESDGVLIAQDGVSWQWYQNGQAIEGAVDAALEVTTDGAYSVLVTGENSCSNLSEEVLVTRISSAADKGLLVFPQPITSSATLLMPPGEFDVSLLDALGQMVETFGWQQNRMDIRSLNLVAGIYFLQLKQNNQVQYLLVLVE